MSSNRLGAHPVSLTSVPGPYRVDLDRVNRAGGFVILAPGSSDRVGVGVADTWPIDERVGNAIAGPRTLGTAMLLGASWDSLQALLAAADLLDGHRSDTEAVRALVAAALRKSIDPSCHGR